MKKITPTNFLSVLSECFYRIKNCSKSDMAKDSRRSLNCIFCQFLRVRASSHLRFIRRELLHERSVHAITKMGTQPLIEPFSPHKSLPNTKSSVNALT